MSSSAYPPGLDDTIIKAQNLGKLYHLYDRPSDRLKHTLFWRFGRTYGRPFWALQDVSFEIKKGETFGIIGKNGSGKSTLLQILAGILQETTGQISVQGRVAALLELGSGFNPEFTGRENVMLNGLILGIPREAMEEKFLEIAEFADIGDFIDQPVKLYSSGMFVRLAFAVAIGVDADILLIDEALAVGDIFFRQKCYKRLESLRQKGVSVLLVSHSMNEVEQFCDRALLLDEGHIAYLGRAIEAVKRYYFLQQKTDTPAQLATPGSQIETPEAAIPALEQDFYWPEPGAFLDISALHQASNMLARCTAVALCDQNGMSCFAFQQGQTASFFFEFETFCDLDVPVGGAEIVNEKGIIVHGKNSLLYESEAPTFVPKGSLIRFRQDIKLEIATGEYTFNIGLASIDRDTYIRRTSLAHPELASRMTILNIIPSAGTFAVVYRKEGQTVQLLHFGIANLPGQCQVKIIQPSG